MNHPEQSGTFVFEDVPSAPTKAPPTTFSKGNETVHISNEDHYWARLFKDHPDSYFCPNCGEIYGNPGFCSEHGDAHTELLEPLKLENCQHFYAKIKAKNPIELKH